MLENLSTPEILKIGLRHIRISAEHMKECPELPPDKVISCITELNNLCDAIRNFMTVFRFHITIDPETDKLADDLMKYTESVAILGRQVVEDAKKLKIMSPTTCAMAREAHIAFGFTLLYFLDDFEKTLKFDTLIMRQTSAAVN
jgi:hypothetical protein